MMTLPISLEKMNAEVGRFDPNIYRAYNVDLIEIPSSALLEHFKASLNEPRVYGRTHTTAEFLSMRWLRGRGLEIGAGSHPTPLFGNSTALLGDCDDEMSFGGESIDFKCTLDSLDFNSSLPGEFDFTIASHVLEHCDSLLRAIKNILSATRRGGISYLVVPDISTLNDSAWLPFYDFEHHVAEFHEPLKFAQIHDSLYTNNVLAGISDGNPHATLSDAYKSAVIAGELPQSMRFIHHKHNYTFSDWIELFLRARSFLDNSFSILDVRYGHERTDCHFVLKANT